jgi:putative addiction module component (TIGR02574 family)
MGKPVIDVSTLSRSERLELLEQLWESLRHESEPLVTEVQRAELASRLAALESGEMKTVPLDQALTAIRVGRAPS